MKELLFAFLWLTLLSGCESYNSYKPSVDGDIVDKSSWYGSGTGNSVLEVRVAIPTPNDYQCKPYDDMSASPRPCTLADVLADKNPHDSYEPELHVHFESDEYLREGVNARFEQKGKSTREAKQASFRVKLDTKIDLYNGERTFQFNKHFYDDTRVSNMLSFELFQSIPHFTSLRTRFVHLLIDGENYGLFTHVEHGDKIYLTNHGFSEEDNLYKAQEYSFTMVDALRLDSNGNRMDEKAFDSILEKKNGKDIEKVVAMTQAIDSAKTYAEFESVFNKYFNRQNYLTWFAVNIILGNKDTTTQNFFLLNPKYSDTFYFLPWDYDGIGFKYNTLQKWRNGVGNWWMSPLHQKFLKIKKNRDDLDLMIYSLRENYISDTIIHSHMDKYRPLIEKYVTSLPDSRSLYGNWEREFEYLRNEAISQNIKNYESEKGHPMPFWEYTGFVDGDFSLGWEESIDFEDDKIVYSLEVSEEVDFNSTIISEKEISQNDSRVIIDPNTGSFAYIIQDMSQFKKGVPYYMRVVSYELLNKEHFQIAFNSDIGQYPGVLEFIIE